MTVEEVRRNLLEELPGEMDSAVSYHQMAIVMKDAKCEECKYLWAIAKDEMQHAKHIHDYLHANGVEIPMEVEARYNSLETAHRFQK